MRFQLNKMPIWWFTTLVVVATLAQASDAQNISHGEQVFKKAGCFQCHAGGGNMIMPNKPLKGEQFSKDCPNDQAIANVIRNGIKNSPMPAFSKDRLSDADMKDLIAYVHTFTVKSKDH
jgi:cytochrome c6